jgi:hypothetical protein
MMKLWFNSQIFNRNTKTKEEDHFYKRESDKCYEKQYLGTECEINEAFIIEDEINLKFNFLESKIDQSLEPNFYSLTKSKWQRRSSKCLEPRDLGVTEDFHFGKASKTIQKMKLGDES